MEVLSRGWRTDLALLQLSGSEILHRPTYVVVRTLGNPTFRWGSFVLLRRSPLRIDASRLEEVFTRELPGIAHRAFGVDSPDGTAADLKVFADLGYTTEVSTVMTATAVHPPPQANTTAEVRPLAGDMDWAQRVELDLATSAGSGGFEEFTRRKAAAERRLTEDGHGAWFGAFDGGRLVAALGIIRAGDGLARYQEVQTHPESRGRGLAGTLVHTAGAHALAELGAQTLVILADPGYHAIRIYRSVGFEGTEAQLQAALQPHAQP